MESEAFATGAGRLHENMDHLIRDSCKPSEGSAPESSWSTPNSTVGGLCRCYLQHGREENAVEVDPVAGSVCGIRGCCDAETLNQRRDVPRGEQREVAAARLG